MALESEIRFFEEQRGELLKNHAGKFVVIKDHAVFGVYDTPQAAYDAGVAQFKTQPFLTKQVLPQDPVERAPAVYTGLVSLSA